MLATRQFAIIAKDLKKSRFLTLNLILKITMKYTEKALFIIAFQLKTI